MIFMFLYFLYEDGMSISVKIIGVSKLAKVTEETVSNFELSQSKYFSMLCCIPADFTFASDTSGVVSPCFTVIPLDPKKPLVK